MVKIKTVTILPKNSDQAVNIVVNGIQVKDHTYPVNDEKNSKLYAEYKVLAEKESKIIFGGRLGEYKYYDMDAVIDSALKLGRKVIV